MLQCLVHSSAYTYGLSGQIHSQRSRPLRCAPNLQPACTGVGPSGAAGPAASAARHRQWRLRRMW